MTTDARVYANRLNAQKSTGPRTPAGKARVAHNAIQHGILCDQAVLPTEDAAAFEEFRDALVGDLSPLGAMEQVLAERIVAASWRLRRVMHHETCLLDRDEGRSLYQEHQMHLDDLRQPGARVHPSAMGEALKESLAAPHSAYDALRRYERSIQRDLEVCLRDLETRQSDRGYRERRNRQAAGKLAELAAALRQAEEEEEERTTTEGTEVTENTEGTEEEEGRRGDVGRGDAKVKGRKETSVAEFSREPEANATQRDGQDRGLRPGAPGSNLGLTNEDPGTAPADAVGFVSKEAAQVASPEAGNTAPTPAPAPNSQSSIANGQSPVGFVSQESPWRGRGPRYAGDFLDEDGVPRDVTGQVIPLEGQAPEGEKNAQ